VDVHGGHGLSVVGCDQVSSNVSETYKQISGDASFHIGSDFYGWVYTSNGALPVCA